MDPMALVTYSACRRAENQDAESLQTAKENATEMAGS